MEKPTNKIGRSSQPRPSRTERKITSIGSVMQRSVIVVKRGLGSGCLGLLENDGKVCRIVRAAACREVDKREIKMEPAAPGSPKWHY